MGTIHLHLPHHLLSKKLIYVLIPLALLHLYLFPFPLKPSTFPSPPPLSCFYSSSSSTTFQAGKVEASPGILNGRARRRRRCDYAAGRWVPDPRPPAYNGSSCSTIKVGQNCMANGRPDSAYVHWRWQPDSCRLRRFDAGVFLRIISGKHIAFIGDSMARNQLESLLCLLAAGASSPELVYRDGDDNKFRRWVFRSHNATVSAFWSPFLVAGEEKSPAMAGLDRNKLYLDSPDKRWARELERVDVAVFSVGHWFLHPAVFHDGGGGVVGCHHCPELNHTEIGFFDSFRKAVRTALKEVVIQATASATATAPAGEKFAVVATFSPAHFEGEWDKAGACPKTEPYGVGEKEMEYMDREMRKIAVDEVAAAAVAAMGWLRIEALDVTTMAMMRPDGHPGPYMNPNPFAGGPKETVQNDCVHWCLPGPIDAWNEVLFEKMMTWRVEREGR